jgi:hypothetical protein
VVYICQKKEQEKENNKGAINKRAEVVNLEDNPNIRPIGHKKAKDECYQKKKKPKAFSAISEKLDKFIEVSTMARKRTVRRWRRRSKLWQIVRLKLLG